MATQTKTRRSGRKYANTRDIWAFGDSLFRKNQTQKLPSQPDEAKKAEFIGRFALIEVEKRTAKEKMSKSNTAVVRVVSYSEDTNFWTLQAYNLSGDPDGAPLEEGYDDVVVLPGRGHLVALQGGDQVVERYCVSSQSVHFRQPEKAEAEPDEKSPKKRKALVDKATLVAAQKPTPKKKKRKRT